MPVGEAQGCCKGWCLDRIDHRQQLEMSAGIDRRGTIRQVGEAGRIAIQAEEERRTAFNGSPFELAELANRWSAIFPEQLPCIGIGGEATDGIGIRAQMIGAIQSRAGEKRFRRQVGSFWKSWPGQPSHKE